MRTSKTLCQNKWTRLLVIIPFVVTGCFLACFYLYLSTPVYEARAILSVTPDQTANTIINLIPTHKSALTEEITSPDFLKTALQNNPGLIQCFTTIDYRKTHTNYSFPYQIAYTTIGNKDHSAQNYTIDELNENEFSITTVYHGNIKTKQGTFGEPLQDNNLSITITKKEKKTPQPKAYLTQPQYSFIIHSPASLANELLSGQLTAIDKSGVLSICTRSENPVHAKEITNALANHYIEKQSIQTDDAAVTDEELEKTASRLAQTETEISAYKKVNQIIDIQSETEKNLDFLQELQIQKTNLEVQMASLDNLSLYLRKNREINNSLVEYGAIADPSFSEQLDKLNKKYEDKIATGTSNSAIDSEIENLKILIGERILNTRKKTAVQIDRLNQSIAATQRNIAKIPDQATSLMALERKMLLDKRVYELLIEKKAAAIIGGTSTAVKGKIITPAVQPLSPIQPINWLILSLGALCGLISGLLVNRIISNNKVNSIQKRADVTELSRIPFLATIPNASSADISTTSIVNNLSTAILIRPNVKIITFASTGRNEGKTFLVTRLAQSLAALEKKVLIVDMSISNPQMADVYSLTPEHTLNDVLLGTCDMHHAISITGYPNVEVLTPGKLTAGINTFLSSSKKSQFLEDIRKQYDYVLIDTPSFDETTDAAALMQLSDLNLYLVRSNTTRKTSVKRAEEIQTDFGIEKLFFVLNDNNTRSISSNFPRRKKQINIQRNHTPQKVSMLRKIALWFY